jgi:hypothetical protein
MLLAHGEKCCVPYRYGTDVKKVVVGEGVAADVWRLTEDKSKSPNLPAGRRSAGPQVRASGQYDD